MNLDIATIITPTVRLRDEARFSNKIGRRESQMLFGETFKITAEFNNWAKGVSLVDGYEGYVECNALSVDFHEPTHFVDVGITNTYREPDFKTVPQLPLSFMSRVAVLNHVEPVGGFVPIRVNQLTSWVPENHLKPLNSLTPNVENIVATALSLEGSPYVYGGRSTQGLDCSALVQLSLFRNGFECPRDADQQMPVIGHSVMGQAMQKGDVLYLPGHVGMMVDNDHIIHATVHFMKAVIEPLPNLLDRYRESPSHNPILDVRRLSVAPR